MEDQIKKTRRIGLGSSDAKMVYAIGKNDSVNESAKQRLAVMLGYEEPKQFSTVATNTGHLIENEIFQTMKKQFPNSVSNPYSEIKTGIFNKLGFKIFNHIDIELVNQDTLLWFEIKATKDSFEKTSDTYKDQLQWHYLIGKDKAFQLGLKGFKLFILHYQVDNYESFEFTAENINQKLISPCKSTEEILRNGLKIISKEIKDFKYEPKEDYSAYCLPSEVQDELLEISNFLASEKERINKLNNFKKKMYQLMVDNNIKSIKTDYFNMTAVLPSKSLSFNSKQFEKDRPRVYKKYLTKEIKKTGYLKIS